MCAGQILGLRMAIYGMKLLAIEEPEGKDRKRLVTFVEIDRCATDAIPIVTGCRLGKRALKFRDFGKVAATFCGLQADLAGRGAARGRSEQKGRGMVLRVGGKKPQQMGGYRDKAEAGLFGY